MGLNLSELQLQQKLFWNYLQIQRIIYHCLLPEKVCGPTIDARLGCLHTHPSELGLNHHSYHFLHLFITSSWSSCNTQRNFDTHPTTSSRRRQQTWTPPTKHPTPHTPIQAHSASMKRQTLIHHLFAKPNVMCTTLESDSTHITSHLHETTYIYLVPQHTHINSARQKNALQFAECNARNNFDISHIFLKFECIDDDATQFALEHSPCDHTYSRTLD